MSTLKPRPPAWVSLQNIEVGTRHRKDLGDIDELAASIRDIGLLHPIVITPDAVLVAGERRLEACKRVGMKSVPVHIVHIDRIVRGELAENAYRKDFTPSEMVAIAATVEKREQELAKQRQGARTDKHPGKFPGSSKGQRRDKIAAPLGVSGRTLEKAKAVVQAAAAEPERFGPLVQEMDRTGSVDGVHRKLCMALDEQRLLGIAPIEGKFRTLVIDPPWDYGDLSLTGRAAPAYATMTHDELLALPVGNWAEENCHFYLWTTNNFMPRAVDLLAAWGFQHKTVITWVKPRWGLGSYFRNATEHVLFGVRGELRTRSDSIGTYFEAPVGEHSEKPERFYEIVRAASYPPYGEGFQRAARPDFANLFETKAGTGTIAA